MPRNLKAKRNYGLVKLESPELDFPHKGGL